MEPNPIVRLAIETELTEQFRVLRTNVLRHWLEAFVPVTLQRLDSELLSGIVHAGEFTAPIRVHGVRSAISTFHRLVTTMFGHFRARTNVVLLAAISARNLREAVSHGTVYDVVRERQNARASLEKGGIVRIIGANGRARRYELDYYLRLLAHQLAGEMQRALALDRATAMGSDVVRVSNEETESFCRKFRGKTFSVSGLAPAPLLASTPNGGPPFHPWCRHRLELVV